MGMGLLKKITKDLIYANQLRKKARHQNYNAH